MRCILFGVGCESREYIQRTRQMHAVSAILLPKMRTQRIIILIALIATVASGWLRLSSVSGQPATNTSETNALSNATPTAFANRLMAMTSEERSKLTSEQSRVGMTEVDLEGFTINGVRIHDPARHTGTESRVAENEQKLLRKVPFFESEEDVQEVGMICAKYRLTRNETISLVGFMGCRPLTNGIKTLAYPYGSNRILILGFDENGNLLSVIGQSPLWKFPDPLPTVTKTNSNLQTR